MSDLDVRMVLLSTDDLDASIAFYTETLGFALKFRDGAHYAALDGGSVTVALATAIDHPLPDRVFAIAERLAAAGAQEIGFGDTTGMANPAQVREFFPAARAALGDGVELTAHFHNTRGQGLANLLAALEEGVESFESSFGELGGCPVPPGSTGNVGSEDVVSMLHEMGVETGIDLPRLIEASRAAQEVLGRPLGSHVLRAGPVDWRAGRSE